MENNINEMDFSANAQNPQPAEQPVEQPVEQPAEQPAKGKVDFAGILQKTKEAFTDGSLLDKIKAIPKKLWIMIGGGVAAVIVLIVLLSILSNTYKTPIQAAEKLLNSKSVTNIIDRAPSLLNGFGESEAKKLIKILKKSDQYEDVIEDAEDAFAEAIEMLKDEYGSNYKIKIKVEEKEKLEKDDLKAFREQLRNIADLGEELDDMDSDDYEDMADELGISKSQAKEMVKLAKEFCKDCKTAKVSAGYELSLVVQLTGSELDEPEETELEVNVFKVDGRWVPDVFSLVGMFGGLGVLGDIADFY